MNEFKKVTTDIRKDSTETTNTQILNFKKAASEYAKFEEAYIEQEAELTLQWANGKMSASEYAEKIKDLKIQYGYIKTDAFDAGAAIGSFSDKLGQIDYKDTENLASNIGSARSEYQETISVLEEYRDNIEKHF